MRTLFTDLWHKKKLRVIYPPANEASREVANLIERKNLHTPFHIWCQRICMSVCLSVCGQLWTKSSLWTVRRGEWNLPHKFHLYLINLLCFFYLQFSTIQNETKSKACCKLCFKVHVWGFMIFNLLSRLDLD